MRFGFPSLGASFSGRKLAGRGHLHLYGRVRSRTYVNASRKADIPTENYAKWPFYRTFIRVLNNILFLSVIIYAIVVLSVPARRVGADVTKCFASILYGGPYHFPFPSLYPQPDSPRILNRHIRPLITENRKEKSIYLVANGRGNSVTCERAKNFSP